MVKFEDSEINWLRYFYSAVDDALGPASGDIYEMIKDEFEKETGLHVPSAYRDLVDSKLEDVK